MADPHNQHAPRSFAELRQAALDLAASGLKPRDVADSLRISIPQAVELLRGFSWPSETRRTEVSSYA